MFLSFSSDLYGRTEVYAKVRKTSVIFKFTEPIYINARNSVERSDFSFLYVFLQYVIVGLCD